MKQLREERDEENEARALLEEMQRNLDEAHARPCETERRLYQELEEYMYSWEREVGGPNNLSAKIWQMMQSNSTKSLNLESLLGWNDPTISTKVWAEKEDDESP